MAHHKDDDGGFGELHPNYHKFKVFCDEMRAMADGEDAVKMAAEAMLPRPIGFTDDEYDLYRTRAVFPPAIEKTMAVMGARAFKEDPEVDPGSIDIDDLGAGGQSFDDILRWIVAEVELVQCCGLLATTVNEDPNDDRESPPQKPAVRLYQREDIIDWYFEDGRLTYIRFDESGIEFDRETMKRKEVTKHVIYMFDEEGYVISFEERKGADKDGVEYATQADPALPQVQGQRMTKIPFQFIGDPEALKSLMRPIGTLAKRYYEITAQLHWLLGKVAAPQFVIEWDKEVDFQTAMEFLSGGTHSADADGDAYIEGERHPHETRRRTASATARNGSNDPTIGAQSIMNLYGATANYVEITGQGITHLINARDEVKEQLIAAGARTMADQTRSNVSTDTVRIENSAEASLLSDVTRRVSKDVTNFLKHVAAFAVSSDATVTLSDEFFDETYSMDDYVKGIQTWNLGGPIEVPWRIATKMKLTEDNLEQYRDKLEGEV